MYKMHIITVSVYTTYFFYLLNVFLSDSYLNIISYVDKN